MFQIFGVDYNAINLSMFQFSLPTITVGHGLVIIVKDSAVSQDDDDYCSTSSSMPPCRMI